MGTGIIIATLTWGNVEEVAGHLPGNRRIHRATAPGYAGTDASQNLTDNAIRFLKDERISTIISFNEYSYTDDELIRLKAAEILYLHLPVIESGAPTLDEMWRAYIFLIQQPDDSGALIHCGDGFGRTGTGITGIQLHTTRGKSPAKESWQTENYVETEEQMKVLTELRDLFGRAET